MKLAVEGKLIGSIFNLRELLKETSCRHGREEN